MSIKSNQHLLVGLAQCDITPPVGTKLAGFAGRDEPSTGVYHPLRAVAVAIDDGATPILILSAEWLGFYDRTEWVRQRIAETTGIPIPQIVVAGTHTHGGPAFRKIDEQRHGQLDHDYLTTAIDRMAQMAGRAWESREAAVLRAGVGQCEIACCRRKPDPAHPPRVFRTMMPHRDGRSDHDVPMITVESLEGKLRGVIFSYACHPTSLFSLEIGGDFVGFALDEIEAKHPGVIPCFLQGCGGDQKPRPIDPMDDRFGTRNVDDVRALGVELAASVLNIIGKRDSHQDESSSQASRSVLDKSALNKIDGEITATRQVVELETEPVDFALASKFRDDPREFEYKRNWANHQLDALHCGKPISNTVPFEIQTIRIGQALAIVTMAGEMSVDYALRLKSELAEQFRHVLPVAYTNAIVGYVPARRQIPEGGYEVVDANMYHQRTGPYVESTEDQIVDVVTRSLAPFVTA